MTPSALLTIDGQVERPLAMSFSDLEKVDDEYQFADVARVDPSRRGDAIRLAGILELAGVMPSATHLGLHASADDFHASIPLSAVADRGYLIYRLDGQPLAQKAGGPLRFAIADVAACHVDEIDECANVKFLDRIELTAGKGFDNRPTDDEAHAKLHGEE